MSNVGTGSGLQLVDSIFETRCFTIFFGLQDVFQQFSDLFNGALKIAGIAGCAKKPTNAVLCESLSKTFWESLCQAFQCFTDTKTGSKQASNETGSASCREGG